MQISIEFEPNFQATAARVLRRQIFVIDPYVVDPENQNIHSKTFSRVMCVIVSSLRAP